ncbi:hypothetical protein [Bifidobacterium adolescentis]|uniref:hypothetical protein n=1 Tax=Bifidobacterium TaxID=1678 RepID=UPI003A4DF5D2
MDAGATLVGKNRLHVQVVRRVLRAQPDQRHKLGPGDGVRARTPLLDVRQSVLHHRAEIAKLRLVRR